MIAGFAGATADAFTLLERLEAKLEQYPDQLTRACVELAKDWRTDKLPAPSRSDDAGRRQARSRWRSPAMATCWSRNMARSPIGSGGNYAFAAARALMDTNKSAEEIARKAHARSPPTSASIPTTMSWWKRWMPDLTPADRLYPPVEPAAPCRCCAAG